jgi:hypothetical protein
MGKMPTRASMKICPEYGPSKYTEKPFGAGF